MSASEKLNWSCDHSCRFTTYRHRFARAASAPRAKRNDSKNRGRASPVNGQDDSFYIFTIYFSSADLRLGLGFIYNYISRARAPLLD